MRKCLKLFIRKVSIILLRFRLKKSELKNFQEVRYSFYGAICKINRQSGIGYRIIPLPECGEFHIIFTLDELAKLRGSSCKSGGDKNNFGENKSQTHRFGVFYSGSDGRITPKYIWDVDLYGDRSGSFPRDASSKAIAGVAWRTMRLSHRPERSFSMTWQGQVERMSWLGLMQQEIRWHLADTSHDLKARTIYESSTVRNLP